MRLAFTAGLLAGMLIMGMVTTAFFFAHTQQIEEQQELLTQQSQRIQFMLGCQQNQHVLKTMYKMKRLNNARLP